MQYLMSHSITAMSMLDVLVQMMHTIKMETKEVIVQKYKDSAEMMIFYSWDQTQGFWGLTFIFKNGSFISEK